MLVFVKRVLDIGFLSAVALVIIPYSFLWALSMKRFRSFLAYRTLSFKSYMVLFLAVGFFTSTLNETSLMHYIQRPFEMLASIPVLLFITIQVLFLGLAMVGFHPLVTISILGSILQPIIGMIDPVSLAIVLTTSGLSTATAGSYNIPVSIGNL